MLIVDRIEENVAVLEDTGETGAAGFRSLPLDWLPAEIREGDVLRKVQGSYCIDTAETEKRRHAAAALLTELTDPV